MKKKTLTIALALVLVVALAVGASYAYLTAQTGEVKNTFTVGKILDDNSKFELKEHEAGYNSEKGIYVLDNAKEVAANTYASVAPKMIVAKDPFVRISTKVTTPAYLYVEVVDNTAAGALSYTLDSANWKPLMNGDQQVVGKNGGLVYYYVTTDAAEGKVVSGDYSVNALTVNILTDKQVTIGEKVTAETFAKGTADTLAFNAYLYQAVGFTTPLAAFQAN